MVAQSGKVTALDLVLLKYGTTDTNAFGEGGVDLRRMGALSYIELKSRAVGVQLVAREERPKRCVIFARKSLGLTNLTSLRGRSIVFGDRASTIACSAKIELVRAGVTGADLGRWDHIEGRKQFLESVYRVGMMQAIMANLNDHGLMIKAVLSGEYDAGVGRYEFVREHMGRDVQILHEFESPPNAWVAATRLGTQHIATIQSALIGAESVPAPHTKGHTLVPKLVSVDDGYYESMRTALRNEVMRFDGKRHLRIQEIQDDE